MPALYASVYYLWGGQSEWADQTMWDSKYPQQQGKAGHGYSQVQGNAFGVVGGVSTSILVGKRA